MEGFEVVLSIDDSIKEGDVCYDQTKSGKISDSGKIDTSCHGTAMNVFIRHKKKPSYLNICEIEVYGKFIVKLFFFIWMQLHENVLKFLMLYTDFFSFWLFYLLCLSILFQFLLNFIFFNLMNSLWIENMGRVF